MIETSAKLRPLAGLKASSGKADAGGRPWSNQEYFRPDPKTALLSNG